MTVVMVVTMVMMVVSMVVGGDDEETGTGDSAADTAFGLESDLFRKAKGLDCLLKGGEGYAQIEESGSEHVPADARGTIEVKMGRGHGEEDRLTQSTRIYKKKI